MIPTMAALQLSLQANSLYTAVDNLYNDVVVRTAERYAPWALGVARRSFLPGAYNLAAYLALREHDLRMLQDRLIPLGLSSLGRSEGHVLPSLAAVRATLGVLAGVTHGLAVRPRAQDFALGNQLLEHNTFALFGSVTRGRPQIMVTLGTDAATDRGMVRGLIDAGMNVARINCAHDDARAWTAMAKNVRHAARAANRPCAVYMDIAGPKIRVRDVLTHKRHHRFVRGETVTLTCTEPVVYARLDVGAQVWIDDGKLGATVTECNSDSIVLTITDAAPDGSKIRPDNGLSFPHTSLPLPALGPKDLADLDRIGAIGDIIGQSFVRNAADVALLLEECERRSIRLPIVAKIETAEALTNLPDIIVAGASAVPFGIMIARGDLAMAIGYPRLAEMQEEVLWICEAAHVPVIWATQVLEQFVKTGIPTRAEISDAGLGGEAECVMLNKGPHVVDAVALLADVLTRMHGHQRKKSARLRALAAWQIPAHS